MEHWNNKNAVIRDLERVSRGRLKVDIDPCLTAGRPVTCLGEEDTEEEFYRRHCSGDANFDEPDLDSITKLIFMVKGDDENYDPIQDNGRLQVSKLNITAAEFIPKIKTNQEKQPKPNKDIPKNIDGKKITGKAKRGNVAITSILAKQLELIKKESVDYKRKLFKPDDFSLIKPKKEEKVEKTDNPAQHRNNSNDFTLNCYENKRNSPKKESIPKPKPSPAKTSINKLERNSHISKTNNSMTSKENDEKPAKPQNGFTFPMFSSPSSMFKRKTQKSSPQDSVKEPVKTPEVPEARRGGYVPSPYAEQCYKKFVQNSEMRKMVTEDLWTRTMSQMKTLDEKRQLEEELKERERLEKRETEKLNLSKNSESVSDDTEGDENLFQYLPGCDFDDSSTRKSSHASTYTCTSTLDISSFPDAIQLPQHRHLLTGECVVCKAEERAQIKLITITSETSDNLIEFSENSTPSSTSVELLIDLE